MRWMTRFLILVLILLSPTQSNAERKKAKWVKEVKRLVEDGLIAPPKDKEVCFSPDERCDLKLLRFLESATRSVDVAIFDLNLDQLVHKLLLMSKDLKVRVLVDVRQSKGPYSLVSTLIKGGVSVKYGRQRGLMHDKFMIVDGKRLETGSFNYTNHASQANQENQVYLDDPAMVSRFNRRFEESWAAGKAVEF